jgi:hypothetical protein
MMRGGALILFPQILSLFFWTLEPKKIEQIWNFLFFLIVNSTLVFVGEEFISKN